MEAMATADIQIRGSPSQPPVEPVAGRRPLSADVTSTTPTLPQDPANETPNDPAEVKQAADGVNAFLKSSGSRVQFEYNADVKQMTVEVIDNSTQQVIRTIPSKELLDLAAKIGEMVGILLDKTG